MKININEEKLRDLYLRKLSIGELQGPLVGKASIDKIWLKHYTEEQILYELPHMSIYEYLYNSNKNDLNNIALNYFGNKMTYNQLFKKIDLCACAFLENGVKKGDIVTICMPNTPETVISFYALNRIGAVANMIHPLSGEKEIENYLNQVDSKLLIMIDIDYPKVSAIINNTKVDKAVIVPTCESMPLYLKAAFKLGVESKYDFKIQYNEKFVEWSKFVKISNKNLKELNNIKLDPNDLAVLFHTGGTTGTPKGVMINNDSYNSSISQIQIDNDIVERGDSLLAIMPMFHGFGSSNCVHLALCSGVTAILVPKFDAKNCDKLIKKYKPNHILGVPNLFEAFLNNQKLDKQDLSNLKYLISGGDKLKPSLEKDFDKFLLEHGVKEPLLKAYGLTEAVAATTRTRRDINDVNSVGIPFVKNIYKVVKIGTTEEINYNEVGELCISGPSLMQGYYKNPEATELVLKKHSDGKMWLHTGDLGYINDDGIIFYYQREKRMIITNGYNVYPSNIEEIIEKHPYVKKCAVVGLEHYKKSEVAIANIILNDECKDNDNYEQIIEEIKNLCAKHLPKYSIPYDIVIKQKFPMTLMNKVDYKQLSREYENLTDSKIEKDKVIRKI